MRVCPRVFGGGYLILFSFFQFVISVKQLHSHLPYVHITMVFKKPDLSVVDSGVNESSGLPLHGGRDGNKSKKENGIFINPAGYDFFFLN